MAAAAKRPVFHVKRFVEPRQLADTRKLSDVAAFLSRLTTLSSPECPRGELFHVKRCRSEYRFLPRILARCNVSRETLPLRLQSPPPNAPCRLSSQNCLFARRAPCPLRSFAPAPLKGAPPNGRGLAVVRLRGVTCPHGCGFAVVRLRGLTCPRVGAGLPPAPGLPPHR